MYYQTTGFAWIPPQILEEGVIVVMQQDGMKRKNGPLFAIMGDLALANRNMNGVLERMIGVLWVMEHGVITTNEELSALQ